MTLDKFITRGFTSSVGESSGSWVSKDPSKQPATSFVPKAEGGTSFVLGSTRPNTAGSRTNGKPFEYRDPYYGFNEESVRYQGTQRGNNAPSGCFGSASRGSRGGNGTIDGHKAVVALFMTAIVIGIAVVITGGFREESPKAKKVQPLHSEKRAPNRSVPPAWYR